MRHSTRKWNLYRAVVLLVVLAPAALARAQRVITSQYDNARTGANLNETKLTPRNVNVQQFLSATAAWRPGGRLSIPRGASVVLGRCHEKDTKKLLSALVVPRSLANWPGPAR
jgi:hypothetical protein